jgi:hypothetical protein
MLSVPNLACQITEKVTPLIERLGMHNNMESNFLDPDGPDDVLENEMDQRACDADPGSIVTVKIQRKKTKLGGR